jgi:hypothetical protein
MVSGVPEVALRVAVGDGSSGCSELHAAMKTIPAASRITTVMMVDFNFMINLL